MAWYLFFFLFFVYIYYVASRTNTHTRTRTRVPQLTANTHTCALLSLHSRNFIRSTIHSLHTHLIEERLRSCSVAISPAASFCCFYCCCRCWWCGWGWMLELELERRAGKRSKTANYFCAIFVTFCYYPRVVVFMSHIFVAYCYIHIRVCVCVCMSVHMCVCVCALLS